jgi:hypothetical protein
MAESEGRPVVAHITVDQGRALEAFREITKTPDGRRAFAEGKQNAFDAGKKELAGHLRDADYNEIPEPVRALLERLSEPELALLSELDATYVDAGLYADVPSPGFLMIH